MRRPALPVQLMLVILCHAGAASAQTLPARPVPLGEPVRGGSWKDGELVLGRTTLPLSLIHISEPTRPY